MAEIRWKSKGQRSALASTVDGFQAASPGPELSCPNSDPSQGSVAVPSLKINVGSVDMDKVVEGGPSICRDGDPSPLLKACSDGCPLQAASSQSQNAAAPKLSDESPNIEFLPVKAVSSGLAAEANPAPTYAVVLRKTNVTNLHSKAKGSAGGQNTNLAEKSFYDDSDTLFFFLFEKYEYEVRIFL
ncbi:hypothetical protein OROGR_008458 [Orobanche gracilis]